MRLLSILLSIACALAGVATAGRPLAAAALLGLAAVAPLQQAGPPALENPGFECGQGYHNQPGISGMVPDGWTAIVMDQSRPFLSSTQMWGRSGSCDPRDMGWEKLEGHDSYLFMAAYAPVGQDSVSPPFDAALYQRISVTPGVAYSLSGWMTSLCGGSATPNDCPEGYYIAKQVGIDPTGGTDPRAASVLWAEDRRPHTTARWVDVRTAATAQATTMTVFVRITSPFWHHGNHAFADAVKLVRAPTAWFSGVTLGAGGKEISVGWAGDPGPDVPAIPAGNYHLYFDVQYAAGSFGAWREWQTGRPPGNAVFTVPAACPAASYRFRVRARAEQPEGEAGAMPNHRFPGIWYESGTVTVPGGGVCSERGYLPVVGR